MISALKVRTSGGTESLIEKIKAEIKKRAEAKAKRMFLRKPKGWRNVDVFSQSVRRIAGLFERRPKQPPQFAVTGCLTALLEVVRNTHRRCLDLNRAINAYVQMRHFALDV